MKEQPKPFNKKLGLFTLFSDRTNPERIMNKIYEQRKKDEALNKFTKQFETYNCFENEDHAPQETA